jgi:hypothetical protein
MMTTLIRATSHPTSWPLQLLTVGLAATLSSCAPPSGSSGAQPGAQGEASLAAVPKRLISGTTSAAADGAFGIAMGQSVDDLNATAVEAGWYKTTSPPKPHRLFPEVVVQATPKQGVCFVKGVGENFNSDSFGSEVRSRMNTVAEQIALKYGQPTTTDFLMPGSIWNEPDDWMMGLLKGERFYTISWDSKGNTGSLRSLRSIALVVSATSSDTAWIGLEYYFKNEDNCDREIAQMEAASL